MNDMDHSRQAVRYLAYLILCGLGMLVGPAMAQDTLSKEDIIKMHIKQLGGEEKLKSIKTVNQQFVMILSGPGGDMEAECELVQDGNKFRMTMSLPGFGEIQQGSNGKNYWTINPAQGDRLMDKDETALAQQQYARPFPALDWLTDYDGKINMKGETDVDGTKCYKLEFVPATGSPITRYFSADDGKMLRFDAVQKGAAGEIDIEVFLSDFKKVDGISLPFKQDTKMEQASMVMEVDSIKFNQEINPSEFKLPASIQKLVDDKK